MRQRCPATERSLEALSSITRDLAHAVRSLGKARAFTLVIYALASIVAVAVGLLAGLPAARRATGIQPMIAMRSE